MLVGLEAKVIALTTRHEACVVESCLLSSKILSPSFGVMAAGLETSDRYPSYIFSVLSGVIGEARTQ